MGNAFQDQFLKAGLVDAKQVKKAQHDKRKNKAKNRDKQAAEDEAKLKTQQALAEKAERDRELNEKRKEEQAKREIAAQIKQLIDTHRQARDDGDIAFNFVDDSKVKRIFVTQAQHDQLSRGALAIARHAGDYHIVAADIADKIRQRDESCIITISSGAEKQSDEDDPYADYKVPDDLMW